MKEYENFFDFVDEWGQGDDFALAGGVTAYDGGGEPLDDPSIGQVKFYRKGWSSGFIEPTGMFKEIETRPCS